MKKKNEFIFLLKRKLLKMLLLMKLTVVILMIGFLQLNAKVFSQEEKVSLQMKNASLEKVIWEIRKQTDIVFMYGTNDIKNVTNISVKAKDKLVTEILKEVLNGTYLTFDIAENAIIIKKDKKPEKKKKTIKGKISDGKGNPLPGASIIVKGTNIGVSSDKDGKFKIQLPFKEKDITLIFSFIGMKTKEIKIKDYKKDVNVKLLEDKKKLDDVIVTGYSTIKKNHFSGNATVVSKKELMKTSPKNVMEALQNYDPSFRLKENSKWGSDPNAMPEFTLRGESSIGMEKGLEVESLKQGQRTNLLNNPNLPVFIMDGFEVSVQKVYDMDMDRIENITILKDAAATALYGSRAANGIILITTRTPKSNEIKISYNLVSTLELPDLSDYNLSNAKQKLRAEVLAGLYKSDDPERQIKKEQEYNAKLQQILSGVDTDWMSQPLENVVKTRHSLYLEGGTNNIKYGLEANYDDNKGIMKGAFRKRKGVGFHFSYVGEKFKLRNYISYSSVNSENSRYGSFNLYATMQPYFKIHDADGRLIQNFDGMSVGGIQNPIYNTVLNNYDGKVENNTVTNNLNIEYKINDNLIFRNQLSASKTESRDEAFEDPDDLKFEYKVKEEKGRLSRTFTNRTSWNINSTLAFVKDVDKHFINSVIGINATESDSYSNNIIYQGFQVGNLNSPHYAAQQKDKTLFNDFKDRLVGFLFSINYSYDNIYLFDGSFRYDGSSKFGSDTRFAPFWSVGAGINVHNYSFFKHNPVVSRLKLRASYGSLGKVNFPSYTAITTYNIKSQRWYKTGSGASLVALGNKDLKWETTKTFDGGFDLGLFNGKISLRANYYHKETVDLIDDFYLRTSSGFDKYKVNSGSVLNEGYEAFISCVVFRNSDWIISASGNISKNKNTITELSKATEEYNKKLNENYDSRTADYPELQSTPLQKYYVGASTSALYAVRSLGIDPCNGKEIFMKKNGTTTYTWSADDQVVVGDLSPDARGSFSLNVGYKGFFLNATFLYEWGAQIYNSTIKDKIENVDILFNNVDRRVVEDRWQKIGDVVQYLDISRTRLTKPTSRFVQNNDYLSFSNLGIGYDFNGKKLGFSRIGIKFNANDIARWSTVKAERGLFYPFSRRYNLTLNLSL